MPRPEHELPSYGRSLLLTVVGALTVLVFIVETVIALAARSTTTAGTLSWLTSASFWSWIAAAETAAWHLKWIAIPVTLLVVFGSRRIYGSIRQSPANFCGLRFARTGYFASAAVPLLVLVLIAVTVPERLRQRQRGIEAGINAQAYATDRLLLQYRKQFGSFPSDKKDLMRLPDPDHAIANLLKELDASEYKPSAEVAAVPNQNPRPLRGAVIRNASLSTATDEPLSEGLSFTNYELRLPGVDKTLNTEDDLLVRDGVITRASETPHRAVIKTAAAKTRQR